MFKIDHVTATLQNEFTAGNAQTGVKPTVVTPDWLNAVQNELVSFIQSRGLTLDKADSTQLSKALNSLATIKDKKIILPNNSTDFLIAEFDYAINEVSGVTIDMILYRKDSIKEKALKGELLIIAKPGSGTFEIMNNSHFDDCGVSFGISNEIVSGVVRGRITCTTTNYTGSNYSSYMIYEEKIFKA